MAPTLASRLTPGTVVTVVDNQFMADANGTTYHVLDAPVRGAVRVQAPGRHPFLWTLPLSVTWDGDLFTYPLPIDRREKRPRTCTYRITTPDTTPENTP